MTDEVIHHQGTGTIINFSDDVTLVEVPSGQDPEEFCEQPRTVRQRRVTMNVAELNPRPKQSLFLVRGNSVDYDNQDLLAVAETAEMAFQIWNNWCVNMGWPRDDDDDGNIARRVEPENIRIILDDVSGTEHEGLNRGLDWGDMPLVA